MRPSTIEMISSPFQTLCCFQPVGDEQPYLLAAAGSIVTSFNLKDGSVLSRWPASNHGLQSSSADNGDGGRPAKRQKLDEDIPTEISREESEESIEIISERKKGERRKPKIESATLPNVSHLLVTSNGKSAVCVTGEDKSVTVFDLTARGVLNLKSRR